LRQLWQQAHEPDTSLQGAAQLRFGLARNMTCESIQQGRIGILPRASLTASLQHCPPAGPCAANDLTQEPRFANAGLPCQQEDGRSLVGKMALQPHQLTPAPNEG